MPRRHPEVVIRSDLLPGWRDVLPRHQPPDARRPLRDPQPPLPVKGGRKGETGPHLGLVPANAFASQRRAGEAGAEEEGQGGRGTGPTYPRELLEE